MEEEDEIQAESCKFPRVGDENGDQLLRRRGGGGSDGSINNNRFHSWHHHSSRIIRVSRASGGKDRHSKVMTSKGLRDRRVRLSVTTAIQFYDLQDRLGYDQPSKAVEWLIKSAADAIAELPSLNNTFPETPKQASNEKKEEQEQGFDDSADAGDYQQNNQSQNLSLSKSACSSTSETSKGSGLSLSRSDIRVNRIKARERARERAAKEKEKEKENESSIVHHQNVNPISQTASFTELLTGGINTTNGSVHQNHTSPRHQWCSTVPMDYFSSGLLGASSSSRTHHQLGHSFAEAMSVSQFNVVAGENHSSDQLQQHFLSFIPDHLIPAVVTSPHPVAGSGDYNLNFTISSSSLGLAGGYNNNNNRGTLQSNSPSSLLPPHMQRFSSQTIDGSSSSSTVPFFIGGAAAAAAATPAPAAATNLENHHHQQHQIQFSPVFDGRGLQLCYGDGTRHSDHKGKAKN